MSSLLVIFLMLGGGHDRETHLTLRSTLLAIRGPQGLSDHAVFPLLVKDTNDPKSSFVIRKPGRKSWRRVADFFRGLKDADGETLIVSCVERRLRCSAQRPAHWDYRYFFVRAAAGPKLQRIELWNDPQGFLEAQGIPTEK